MNEASFKRINRIAEVLQEHIITKRYPFTTATLSGADGERTYHAGDYFGGENANYDMTMMVSVPDFDPANQYVLTVGTRGYNDDNSRNPQIKLFIGTELVQAFDVNHHDCPLDAAWFADGALTFRLQIYAGRDDKKFPLDAVVNLIDPQTRTTYFDFMTYLGCWKNVTAEQNLDNRYRAALEEAANRLDLREIGSEAYQASLTAASQILHDQLDEAPDPKNGTIYAIGHTHIDMAWLWPIEQTVEKANRSFATVLNLMKQYPEFQFMHSSPQLYKWIKEKYPSQYAEIKAAVKAGRWHPEGAMWIEPDTNLPSGESLVRQLMYGKRFFKREFDIDSKVLWLPDVFGYSASLPQLMKKAGVDYFMTTKLAWNDTNIFPDTSFYWQGIDGTQVVAHIINTISEFWSLNEWYSTYSGLVTPNVLKKTWDKYRQKDVSDSVLVAYGWGDGGGGPTPEMMEYLNRFQHGIAGMPRVRQAGVREYFDHLAGTMAANRDAVPVWMGELYFEFHRGTYTSQAHSKHANRALETQLQSTEKLLATTPSAGAHREVLGPIWERALLNQFHDVLPGSSIPQVYQQTDQDYATAFSQLHDLQAEYAKGQLTPAPGATTVYNPLGQTRSVAVELPLTPEQGATVNGQPVATQQLSATTALVQVPEVAPFAFATITPVKQAAVAVPAAKPLGQTYETAELKVKFDAAYNITSLYDKQAQREVVPAGGLLNQLVVYQDLPTEYDAWNVDSTYHAKSWPVTTVVSATIEGQGALRDTLHIVRRFEHSTIDTWLHFIHGTTQIQIDCDLDWHDDHTFLRCENAVAVNATEASYDIQFGNLTRPVNKNTSWEQAKFEVPAQKWADLSDNGYGLSILTDAKYGYDAGYQHLGVSLHRCPTFPDPQADTGHDRFTYTLFPHAGGWREAGTMQAALALNTPAVVWSDVAAPAQRTEAWVSVAQPNIIIDTIKPAEDDAAIILRAYEYANAQTTATITFQQALASADLCNLLEQPESALTISPDGHTVTVPFGGFAVQTIRVTLK